MASAKLYETADIWAEAWNLLVSAKGTLLAYMVVSTVAETIVDQTGENLLVELASSATLLFMGYWLIISMMYFGGLAPGGVKKGFWTYLGVTLLFAIAVGIGWLALVFPAFYFAIRFAPVFGYGMGEADGFRDAFARSWNATMGHFWEIAGALFVPMILLIIAFGISEAWSDEASRIAVVPSLAVNLVVSAAGATLTAIGMGVYAAARTRV